MKPKDLIEKMEEMTEYILDLGGMEVVCMMDDDEHAQKEVKDKAKQAMTQYVASLIQSVGEELIGRDEADEDRIDLGWLKKEYRDDLRSEQRSRLAEIISEIKKEEK